MVRYGNRKTFQKSLFGQTNIIFWQTDGNSAICKQLMVKTKRASLTKYMAIIPSQTNRLGTDTSTFMCTYRANLHKRTCTWTFVYHIIILSRHNFVVFSPSPTPLLISKLSSLLTRMFRVQLLSFSWHLCCRVTWLINYNQSASLFLYHYLTERVLIILLLAICKLIAFH